MNNIKAQYLGRFISIAGNHYDGETFSHHGMEELIMLLNDYSNLVSGELFSFNNRLNPSIIDDFCSFIIPSKEAYLELSEFSAATALFTKICFYLDMKDLWLKDDCFGYLLIFPGMGKTTFAHNPTMLRVADCDFGHLRRSLYDSSDDFKNSGYLRLFYQIYVGLASSLSTENDVVLINDYHPFVSANSDDIQRIRYTFIPQLTSDTKSMLIKGIKARGHDDFAGLMNDKFDKWISEWKKFSYDNQIDCVELSIYFSELIKLIVDGTVVSLEKILNSIKINRL